MQRRVLGILSLDTAFPRIPGDAGNVDSYRIETIIEVVPGAESVRVVSDADLPEALLEGFEAAARRLEDRGAVAIVSTCGFLVTAQARIATAVRVPVLVSGLSLYPLVRAARPGRIGILTASAKALGHRALAAAGIDRTGIAIAGLEDVPAFADVILVRRADQPDQIDRDAIEAAVVAKALALQAAHGDLAAILLECGNLPPYASAIRAATGLPVFHIVDAAHLLVTALHPSSSTVSTLSSEP